jgi:hypothetical protein
LWRDFFYTVDCYHDQIPWKDDDQLLASCLP